MKLTGYVITDGKLFWGMTDNWMPVNYATNFQTPESAELAIIKFRLMGIKIQKLTRIYVLEDLDLPEPTSRFDGI